MKLVCQAKYNSDMTPKYNIICLSNQLWDTTSPTNKHHVMYRLAKLGHSVLYVDPPINMGRIFAKQIKAGFWDLRRFLTQTRKDSSSLLVYTPLNVVPFSFVTSSLHVLRLRGLAQKFFSERSKTILWVYHVQIPRIDIYLKSLDYDMLVYDCVDNYEGMRGDDTFYSAVTKNVLFQEETLAKAANVIFAVTPMLVEKLGRLNSNIYWVPNAGDYELFKDAKKYKYNLPIDIKDIPRPRIGYIGALDEYKFDSRLLRKCALDYPQYSFVLIGPLAIKSKDASLKDLGLLDLPNIFYLGPKPYAQKKHYLAGFDAEVIPFQLNDYTLFSYPVKFHDSLSAGIPIVATNLPAFSPYKDVSYISKNYEEFSNNLKKALEEDSTQKMKMRQEVAKKNSWDAKVERMLEHINQITRP